MSNILYLTASIRSDADSISRALVLGHDVDRKAIDRDILEGGGKVHGKADRAEDRDIADRRAQQRGDDEAGDH
ncbi:MAG: hypothetical protein ACK554_02765, partial [Erythrobacteraceae bacterium]